MLKQFSLNKLLILVTTFGFTFLLLDTIIEHWPIFEQELIAFVPLVFSFAGIVLGVFTVVMWKEKLIYWFQILLVISILVGVAGLYFHVEPFEEETNLTAEEIEHEANEKEKPLLAPLSFAGIAVIGLLGTLRKWEAEVK
jgi:glucan phosphoethanolaminetransferase (alkaline phosphatase superfamily)